MFNKTYTNKTFVFSNACNTFEAPGAVMQIRREGIDPISYPEPAYFLAFGEERETGDFFALILVPSGSHSAHAFFKYGVFKLCLNACSVRDALYPIGHERSLSNVLIEGGFRNHWNPIFGTLRVIWQFCWLKCLHVQSIPFTAQKKDQICFSWAIRPHFNSQQESHPIYIVFIPFVSYSREHKCCLI